MNPFAGAARFLSVPPGDLVYHLVVLFAVELILALAWSQIRSGNADRAAAARRWVLAALGLTAGRLLLVLAAAFAALRLIPSPGFIGLLPPLERFVEAAGLGLVAWAFIPLLARYPRAGAAFAVGNLILAAIVYAWAAPQWWYAASRGITAFNGAPQDIVWSVWVLVLAGFSAAALLWDRQVGWGILLVAFGLIAAGQLVHLLFPDRQLAVAEWPRLAALAAYPLLAAFVLNHVIQLRAPQAPAVPAVGPRAASITSLWPVAEACRQLAETNDLPASLQQVAGAVAQSLNADLAAIGMPAESPDSVQFAAVYFPGVTPTPGAAFQLENQPTIKRAITSRTSATLGPEQGGEAMALSMLLGSQMLRLMRVEPLVYNRQALGILLLSRSPGELSWLTDESFARAAKAAADQIASALGLARKMTRLEARAGELTASLNQQEGRAAEARQALEDRITQSQAGVARLAAELQEAREQTAFYQKRSQELAALVDLAMQDEPAESNLDQAAPASRRRQEEAEHLAVQQSALEKELEDARQQLASLRQELDQSHVPAAGQPRPSGNHHQVVTSLAQELRTPMTSITGYTDLLLGESSGILGAMQRQFLLRVKANVERMHAMLDDLIRVTASDFEQYRLKPESVDLVDIVKTALAGCSGQFDSRSLSVKLDLAEHLPLCADRDSLAQIVAHLLTNAYECSQPGTQVALSAHSTDGNFVSLSVADTGGGIDPNDRPRVFSRRYRADNPLIQGLGDTGVGLSIVKTLVEAHGGRVWVESDMGSGSTFSVLLPANQRAEVMG